MKKLLITLSATLFLSHFSASAQYQIRNGNFESWDSVGTAKIEPTHWNSFKTASGSFALFGQQQLIRSEDTHSGEGYCIKIFAKDLTLAVANGMVTTGQVNMGSFNAADTANHNVTRINNDDFNAPLIAIPDSISFWAKFDCPNSSQEARMNAVVHTNIEYKDPGGDTNYVVAIATKNFTQCAWTKFTIPFSDFRGRTPAFILITFATNAVPGAGSNDDTLSIDDVELIYNERRLSTLELDGVEIGNFDKDTMEYTIDNPSDVGFPVVTCSTISDKATYSITQATSANTTATVVVTNGDPALNNVYKVHFKTPLAIEVPAVSKDNITIFPNPSKDYIQINSSYSIISVDLYDMVGKLVKREMNIGRTQTELSLSNTVSGLYLLKITTEKGSATRKLVVK